MESHLQTQSHIERQQNHRRGNMKKSSSRNSESSCLESPHSPLRFHSPLPSDAGDLAETPPYESPSESPLYPPENTRAIVSVEKADNLNRHSPDRRGKPPMIVNRAVKEDAPPSVAKVGPGGGEYVNGTADGRRSNYATTEADRRTAKNQALNSAALGFRISEFVLCLISFSVMAADRTQGWSGDSFDRYKEYRYCLCVNVIGFGYALFQTYNIAYYLGTRKNVIKHHLRRHFELFMDQVLAYLLISAASSAATRVDDWESNWGRDEFTKMASASVVMAFLAFAAFSISSLISGYNLWNENSA